MKPQKRNNPAKNRTVLAAVVIAMLTALLAACSPASDDTTSQSGGTNGTNPTTPATEVNGRAPTEEPATTEIASPIPTPEAEQDPTTQATSKTRQPEPAAADEPPTPETDREYTLDELRQMLVEMVNEERKIGPIRLGDSLAAQIRAEDAAANCLSSDADDWYLQQQAKWAVNEDDLPLLYWDTHGFDSATALALSGDDGQHFGTVITSQACTHDTPYTAHDRASIIEEIRQTVPFYEDPPRESIAKWGDIERLFDSADTMHVGIALAESPNRGYYIYLMFTGEDPIEWTQPPTIEGSVLKASGRVPETSTLNSLQLSHIRRIPAKPADGTAWHRCHQDKQYLGSFREDIESDVIKGRYTKERTEKPTSDYYHVVTIDRREGIRGLDSQVVECLRDRQRFYLIQAEGGTYWSYPKGDREFAIEADLAPILEDPQYGPGMYFVEFKAEHQDYPYPIWLGMDPPEENPYRQP